MRQLKPELNLLSWGGRHGLDAAECEAIVSHGYCQMEALKIGHPSRSCLSVARLGALAPGLHSLHIWDYRPSPGRETALTNNMPGIATACPKLVSHVQYVFEIRIYHKYTVYPALLQIH